ncbi:MAG: TonB-dependent receptor [Bacteroidetes bacterium]|nr:TonB-dependent receptor [Bacteroidota bacterium]
MIVRLQIKNFVALIGMCLSLLLISLSGYSQSALVTGTVTDAENGQPLPGVTVTVKGAATATVTGSNGSYSIRADSKSTLVFKFIGYASQEVAVGGSTNINVKLTTDNRSLTEVVVVGYGTQKRKDLTGSISSVGAKQIEQVPVTTLDQALQGRAAGVQVTNNDGSPGGNVSVLIRGVGSLATNGNGPLYVVDGYPLDGGIGNINPYDIASIDILKDASATAIYGIRAANGVVIITTKRGRKDGTQVNFDTYDAFQGKPREYHVLNAQQWATLANEVADADPQHNFVELPQWRNPSSLTNIDWQNAVYRTGLAQNYNLAIRGGGSQVQSAASLAYYDQKGIVLGSYFKRLTLGLNVDYQPFKWLQASSNIKYSYEDANNPFGTGALVQLSELPPTMDGGNKLTSEVVDANGNYGFYNPNNTYVAKYGNPVFTIESDRYQNITNNFLTNFSLQATVIDGLKIKSNAGLNLNDYSGSFFQPSDDRIDQQYNLGGATQNALYSQHLNNTFNWVWENTVSYDKTFGLHTINFVGGVSEQENIYTAMGGSGIPPNNVIRDLQQTTNLLLDVGGNGQNIYSLASQFGRLSYNYAGKYYITGTVRRDGSSKFNVGHQYGTFPSGAVKWKAKEESFLKNVDWLSDLNFRGSYGEVGNQGSIGTYQYLALYSTTGALSPNDNAGYPFNKVYLPGIVPTQPANPDLKWETDYQTDIGIDASFLNGELTVTADWYKRKSKDFLLTLAAPAQTGYNFETRNVGSMENSGLEFAISYNHAVNRDVRFGATLTLATVNNKLTSITSGTTFVTNLAPAAGGLSLAGLGWGTYSETNIGQPVGEFYGYKSVGIFQSQAQINALNAQAAAKNPSNPYYQQAGTGPGDRYFADLNGDGQVTPSDQTSLGSPLPKFYGGLNLDFSYKAWDINAYFYGVYGNKILNYEKSTLGSFQNRSFVGVENVSYDYYINHWTPSNPSNVYSRVTYNDDAIGSNVPSSAWIEDGSFLKLKNLTIGYTLQPDIAKKLAVSKIRVYVSTQNLFTITKYSGLDPEIGIQNGVPTNNGIDNGTYPGSKYFTIGLNVTF